MGYPPTLCVMTVPARDTHGNGYSVRRRPEKVCANFRVFLWGFRQPPRCSIATMDACVRLFAEFADAPLVEALEAASLRPAQLLGASAKACAGSMQPRPLRSSGVFPHFSSGG